MNNRRKQKLTELLYKKFKSSRATDTLQELLDVIGEDKRDDVILAETDKISALITGQV